MGRIFHHAYFSLRHDPRPFAIFAVSGLFVALVPTPFSNIAHIVAVGVALLFSYRALGGTISDEVPLNYRVLYCILLLILMAIPVGIGLLFFALPGLYLMGRLWAAIPVVLIDGAGPLEALDNSWEATQGTLSAVGSFAAFVVFGGLLLIVPIVRVVDISFITATLAAVFVGPLLTAGFAAVYHQFVISGAISSKQTTSTERSRDSVSQ